MVAPARKRVAAAAAIAAPDLEVSFMTFLQKDVGNDLKMRIKSRRLPGVRMRVNLGSNENDPRLTSCNPLDLRHWITHPELTTDDRRFGYSSFKRKFSFFWIDSRSMPNPDRIQIFHCASGGAASMPPSIR